MLRSGMFLYCERLSLKDDFKLKILANIFKFFKKTQKPASTGQLILDFVPIFKQRVFEMKHLMLINYFVLIAILIVVADENRKTITVGKSFTFQIPQELIDQKVQGMDSLAGQYKSASIQLSFDYGMYANDLKANAKKAAYQENEIKINGKLAKKVSYKDDAIKDFPIVVGLHIADVVGDGKEAFGKSKLTMMAYCKDKKDIKIVEDIFSTIKFADDNNVKVAEFLGGKNNLEVLQKFDKATAFRIETGDQENEKNAKVLSTTTLTKAQSQKLVELLSSDNSYIWDESKKCLPNPGVLIEFEKGAQKISLRFCFECQILILGDTTKKHVDFDPITQELIKLMKEVFPKDAAIQKLK